MVVFGDMIEDLFVMAEFVVVVDAVVVAEAAEVVVNLMIDYVENLNLSFEDYFENAELRVEWID